MNVVIDLNGQHDSHQSTQKGVVLGRRTPATAITGGAAEQKDSVGSFALFSNIKDADVKAHQAAVEAIELQSILVMQELKIPEGQASDLLPELKTLAQAMSSGASKHWEAALEADVMGPTSSQKTKRFENVWQQVQQPTDRSGTVDYTVHYPCLRIPSTFVFGSCTKTARIQFVFYSSHASLSSGRHLLILSNSVPSVGYWHTLPYPFWVSAM